MSSPGSIWRIIDEWANACSILNKQSCWIGESWRRKNAFWISKDGILLCREFKSRYEKCKSRRVLSLDIVTWEIESFHEKILFRHHNNNKVIEKKISSKVGCLPSFTLHTWSFLQLLAKTWRKILWVTLAICIQQPSSWLLVPATSTYLIFPLSSCVFCVI